MDFHKIKNEHLNKLITTGIRVYDISLRFKYAGIGVDMMTNSMKQAVMHALESESEVVYILVNYTALYPTEAVLKSIEGDGKE